MAKFARLEHVQAHPDYVPMSMVFRPFVMCIHTPDYHTKSVNTDRLGWRVQYGPNGERLDLDTLRDRYAMCDVLVGNSTIFGVDATSDHHTTGAHLNRLRQRNDPGVPLVSMGIRGATTQQELVSFLWFRHLLPKIRRVVIVSGVNEPTIVASPEMMHYPDVGAIFGEPRFMNLFRDQYAEFEGDPSILSRNRLHEFIHQLWSKHRVVRKLVREIFAADVRTTPRMPTAEPAKRLKMLEPWIRSCFATWADLGRGAGFSVEYVIQPIIGWTGKPLAPFEEMTFSNDLENIPSLRGYANPQFGAMYKARLAALCSEVGIACHDANEWFEHSPMAHAELFTDVCHLTDDGYRVLAEELHRRLLSGS